MPQPIRQFRAHAAFEDTHAESAVIEAATFEQAALAFAERWIGEGEACRVTLRDTLTGEQHCFTLHVDGDLSEGC